jgi:Na+-driven multidrug efflux pump
LGLLTTASIVILFFSDALLRAWLGSVEPLTGSILPLVLIHTVLGGASGIGRAVILGMGWMRAHVVSSIAAGLLNVVLAIVLAGPFELGLVGVVYATIVTVSLRCALWMPWFVLSRLQREERAGHRGNA